MGEDDLPPEEADLERALERAANEPAYRPQFYRVLLAATVFVVGDSEPPTQGLATLAFGSKVLIQSETSADGARFIPFFSSLKSLRGFIRAERNYLSLPARSLFELTRGERLVLNPAASFGKEFLPEEIEALLSSESGAVPESRIVERESKVLLGQPQDYPTAMVASLSKLFAENERVKAAYVALMHDPAVDQYPHLLVGIEADGDFSSISRDAGVVISATTNGEPVDIVRVIASDQGLSQYFVESTTPFFQRDQQRH